MPDLFPVQAIEVGRHDFYPTTPDVVEALDVFVRQMRINLQRPWWSKTTVLDPCAGCGAIIYGLKHWGDWAAYEIQEAGRPWLEPLVGVPNLMIGDALQHRNGAPRDWPAEMSIVMNPPYGDEAERFVARTHEHARTRDIFCAALLANQWWDESGGDRIRQWQPDIMLRIPWRISFKGGNRKGSRTHAWAMWLPEEHPLRTPGSTRTWWAEKPEVSPEAWARHAEMTGKLSRDRQVDLL